MFQRVVKIARLTSSNLHIVPENALMFPLAIKHVRAKFLKECSYHERKYFCSTINEFLLPTALSFLGHGLH